MIKICLQVLAEENQKQIVEFCKKEGLVLLADEVNIKLKMSFLSVQKRFLDLQIRLSMFSYLCCKFYIIFVLQKMLDIDISHLI